METKKILVIGLTERMGGVETFIYNTTMHSDTTKYKYEYLVHGADECVFQNEIIDFYKDETCIHFIPKFKKHPIKTFIKLYQFYKKNSKKFSYIHLQTGATSEVLYVFPFNLLFGIDVITHSHNGNGYSPIINTLFKPIVNFITKKRLSCSDEATKWLFGSNHLDDTVIINNGIDTNRFSFNATSRNKVRNQYNISSDTLVVGHIGRFSEQKNHERIIDIFNELLEEHSNSMLLLVGVGEKEKEIKEIVSELGLSDYVIFAGRQMKTEEYYCAFDVFLMPSLYEGLPIVGIEAQSMGLPCFFSDNIDSKVVLTDRAQLISLDEPSKVWAQKILALNDSMNRTSYNEVIDSKKFSIKSTVRELEKIYEV
ncbi:glycosyltransferase [Streptococcus gallolyticus subsp. gallolyticus]|uniref:glycosyltransferase n=1 Tax=Streptococcus gallolyticus TaxID=315405 RepID=UPI000210B8EC|nr:glycosyltransferase [Streptococcus gallolyticus]KJE99970.1 glycosyl transferase family 1 [Streptococcus gallolyticus subsp. gallolyticus]MCY7157996.1 glycosyltransferase [Streptococcus gallolyticus subsp. gallolyticus]BAK27815.1 glycosyl transferase family 1 [Streptococcus gallolyticus subsp. gallolyticus ATCC 43143]